MQRECQAARVETLGRKAQGTARVVTVENTP